MFSSGTLVHIVFANANDTYYCNHVMALEQEQYLWLRLREEGFRDVVFLDFNGGCTVRRYGAPSQFYNIKKNSLSKKKEIARLQDLIRSQLQKRNTERTAFICRLPGFCEAFGEEEWLSFLSELPSLPQRTGILVLSVSPEAEAAKPYLLTSPVFDRLKVTAVTAVRTAEPCSLFSFLSQKMPEDAVYLNVYTKSQLLNMLRYLFMTEPEKSDDCDKENAIAEYLYQYLHNPAFRRDEARRGVILPEKTALFQNMLGALRSLPWNLLIARVEACVLQEDFRRYLAAANSPYVPEPYRETGVLRTEGTYAHRCLMLSLPEDAGDETEKLRELLEGIRTEVTSPKNRMENSLFADTVKGLLDHVDSACQTRDFITLRRVLESVDFCLKWINVLPDSKEETTLLGIADQLKQYIICSAQYSTLCASLRDTPALSGAARQMMERSIRIRDTLKLALDRYEDFFNARRMEMTLTLSLDGLSSLTDGLQAMQEDISRTMNAPQDLAWDTLAEKKPAAGQAGAPAEKEEDDYEYVLRMEDEDFVPPQAAQETTGYALRQ